MSDRISRKDLAAEWGVSTQAIDKLVHSDQLTVGEDKLLSRAQAETVRKTLEPGLVEKEAIAKELGGQAAEQQNSQHPLVRARTAEAVLKVKQREIQLQKARGELIEIAKVKTEAYEIGRALQQQLLAFPARLSAELATLAALPTAEIEPAIRKLLATEVRTVITNLIAGLDQVQSAKT